MVPKLISKNSSVSEASLLVQTWDPSCDTKLNLTFEAQVAKCQAANLVVIGTQVKSCAGGIAKDLQYDAKCAVPLSNGNFVSKWSVKAKNQKGKESPALIESVGATYCADAFLDSMSSSKFQKNLTPIPKPGTSGPGPYQIINPRYGNSTGPGVIDPSPRNYKR
ncbi:hypothetical protein WDW86_18520 [Bdellovibrionota bacterium FG-2]